MKALQFKTRVGFGMLNLSVFWKGGCILKVSVRNSPFRRTATGQTAYAERFELTQARLQEAFPLPVPAPAVRPVMLWKRKYGTFGEWIPLGTSADLQTQTVATKGGR